LKGGVGKEEKTTNVQWKLGGGRKGEGVARGETYLEKRKSIFS